MNRRSQSGDQGSNKTEPAPAPASASPSQPQGEQSTDPAEELAGHMQKFAGLNREQAHAAAVVALTALTEREPAPESPQAAHGVSAEDAVNLVRQHANAAYGYGPKGSRDEFDRAFSLSPLQLATAINAALRAASPQAQTAQHRSDGLVPTEAQHVIDGIAGSFGSRSVSPGGVDWSFEQSAFYNFCAALAAAPQAAAQSTALEPVAWRHNRTLCLYETEEEVPLADGDEWAEPLYATPSAAMALLGEAREALQQTLNVQICAWNGDVPEGPIDALIARIDALTGRKEQRNG